MHRPLIERIEDDGSRKPHELIPRDEFRRVLLCLNGIVDWCQRHDGDGTPPIALMVEAVSILALHEDILCECWREEQEPWPTKHELDCPAYLGTNDADRG